MDSCERWYVAIPALTTLANRYPNGAMPPIPEGILTYSKQERRSTVTILIFSHNQRFQRQLLRIRPRRRVGDLLGQGAGPRATRAARPNCWVT